MKQFDFDIERLLIAFSKQFYENGKEPVSNGKNYKKERTSFYLKSYKTYIGYFNNKSVYDNGDIQIAIAFAYSWMPRIPHVVNTDAIKKGIQELKNLSELNAERLDLIRLGINNSIVGTSKVLHFLYPDKYPIFDSKIFNYCGFKGSINHHSSTNKYIDYCEFVHYVIDKEIYSDENHSQLKEILEENNYYSQITKVRGVELLMFSATN